MKKVLKEVVGNEQQGFIPDGDIAGNLLLVKEIINIVMKRTWKAL